MADENDTKGKRQEGKGEENSPNDDDVSTEEDVHRLDVFLADMTSRLVLKSESRKKNDKENITYPESDFFSKLDSSIKKNSAFVKKLRVLSESQRDAIIREINVLNLSKYISEVTSSLVEAKIKMTDVPLLLNIAEHLHHRYAEFSAIFLDTWLKALPRKPSDLPNVNSSKLRTDLRVFSDLISFGIFPAKEGLTFLNQIIGVLTASDKDSFQFLPIILSFVKNCAEDYIGIFPRSIQSIARKNNRQLTTMTPSVSPEKQKTIHSLLKDYFKNLTSKVQKDRKSLRYLENQNRKILASRGELSQERKDEYEQQLSSFTKLVASGQQLADLLDEDFPDFSNDASDLSQLEASLDLMSIDVSNRFKGSTDFNPSDLWEDEDSKSFYQNVPDLKALIPSILYKESCKEDAPTTVANINEESNEEVTEADDLIMDTADSTSNPVDLLFVEVGDAEVEVPEEVKDEKTTSTSGQKSSTSNKVLMDSFLTSLLTCVNRDMIDKMAVDFCTNLNTKHNRNRLARSLFSVPRTRLDLLPFYGRLVKALDPVMPQVAHDLIQLLKQDFKFHVRKKDQINIESKIKTIRFIGELIKFELFSRSDAIQCLRVLLLDFAHHQIEMTCSFLECCGRFMFRSPDTHAKMTLLMEQMMRKKALLPYDSRYITMIENAYYSANPISDSVTAYVKVDRPPLHEYLRKLVYTDLAKGNVLKISRLMRKLDWEDNETTSYSVKVLSSAWNVNFNNIKYLADLLSLIKVRHDSVVCQVIDNVLEDIRIMMEINQPKFNQRRLTMVKYLGEMYAYRLVDAAVIFQELYSFITFGVDWENPNASLLDPPDNLFRIRLSCQLLATCGEYFTTTTTKKELDCFLIFFQKYFWFKRSHDIFSHDESNYALITIRVLFEDTIKGLRPKFLFASDYKEACQTADQLLFQLKPKISSILQVTTEGQVSQECGGGQNLQNSSQPTMPSDLNAIPEEAEDTNDSNTDNKDDEEEEEERDDADDDYDDMEEDGDENESSSSSDAPLDEEEVIERNSSVPVIPGKKPTSNVNDEEFQKEFERMIAESYASRSQEVVRSHINEVSIPIDKQGKGSKPGKTVAVSTNFKEYRENNVDFDNTKAINLTVLTRTQKGNKPVLKKIQVSLDSQLAISLKEKEQMERKEKMEIKRLTLELSDRIDEHEAALESKGPSGGAGSHHAYRKKNYFNHPKGAPDADLIFGSQTSTNNNNNPVVSKTIKR